MLFSPSFVQISVEDISDQVSSPGTPPPPFPLQKEKKMGTAVLLHFCTNSFPPLMEKNLTNGMKKNRERQKQTDYMWLD